MLRNRLHAAALAIASLCGFAAATNSADAAVIQYLYSGTVDYGYDRAEIFGQDQSLTGKVFTLIERFDTDRAAYRYVDSAQSLQFGGTTRGASNAATLTVTIGDASRTIADLEDYIYSGSVTGKHQDFVKDATGYEYAGFYLTSPLLAADYGTAQTLDATQATFIGNYQFFSKADTSLATYASFNVHRLTVAVMSPVPLPPSIALFGASLLGLAIVSGLRRWRSTASR